MRTTVSLPAAPLAGGRAGFAICSGLGGIFPKGLLIGTVASVKSNPGELGLKVEVAPSADFSRLEELLVVFPEATP